MTDNAAANAGPDATLPRPDATEVAAELQRVLGSQCFQQSDRAKEFLRFVVEETLAGRGDRLKGYTIGVEVFGRPTDFDAQTDPLVRVEAGRIRRRLAEYYGAEGARNPIRIALERGAYTPQFSYVKTAQPDAVAAEILGPNEPPAARSPTRFLVAGAVVAVTLFGLILWRTLDPATTPAAAATHPDDLVASGPPKVLVLPFDNLSDDIALEYFAHGITEEIILRLSEFEVLVVSGARTADPGSAATVPSIVGVSYVLTGTVRNTPDRVRLSVRLSTADTGEQLWGEAFDEPAAIGSLLAFQERIAEQVAGMVTRPLGPIFQQQLERSAHALPEYLDTYDCVLRFRYYRHTFAPVDHSAAVGCFRAAVEREPNLADAWSGLALMYLDEYLYGYNPEQGGDDALTRAGEAARRGLDIDGNNRLANLAIARVRLNNGDVAGFRRGVDRLLELRPRYPDDLMTVGSLLVVTGDSRRGLELVEEAIGSYAPDRPPGTYFIAHAFSAIIAGDDDRALEYALKIDVPDWVMTPMIVAACAGLAGDTEIAQRATQRLLDLNPEFPSHARAQFAKWYPDETLLRRILEGLEAAGLDVG